MAATKTPTKRTAPGSSKSAKDAIAAARTPARKAPAKKATAKQPTTSRGSLAGKGVAKRAATPAKTTASTSGKTPENVVLTQHGEPTLARNSLSYMAWIHSVGLDSKTRLGVKEFVGHLAKHHGIEDPFAKSWDIVLANGHRVGAIVGGAAPKPPAKADLDKVEVVKATRSSTRASKPSSGRKPSAARLNAHKAEKTALLTWRNGGEKGPRPATPIIDEYAELDRKAKEEGKLAAEAREAEKKDQAQARRDAKIVKASAAVAELLAEAVAS